MVRAIGLVEFCSIAKGIEVADHMLKSANIELITAVPTCPGKYMTLVHGDISAVANAVKAAEQLGGEFMNDSLVIPNVDEQIFPAIACTAEIDRIQAIGVIESFAIPTLIQAADICVKAADVELMEIRLGTGIGGKSFLIMTGDVSDVNASTEAGVNMIKDSGNLVHYVVIPSPHKDFKKVLM